MIRFNAQQTQWLKISHLLLVSIWVGGQISFMMLQLSKETLTTPEHMHAVIAALKLVDDWVIIPGALGCLLTGLFYGLFTPWGFFRHRWVLVKWVCTVALILFGTFFLGPWINGMAEIAAVKQAMALSDATYLQYEQLNTNWGSVQLAVNIGLIAISVIKPWKHLKMIRTKGPLH
jgi:hypothetical protein